MSVIFVSGVHGVGKTTLCRSLSERIGAPHYSASQLIAARKAESISVDSKKVLEPHSNQSLLQEAVKEVTRNNITIILDGHFTLIDCNEQVVSLNPSLFESLELVAVVFVVESPRIIRERIMARDGVDSDYRAIRSHQCLELVHGRYILSLLRIPYVTASSRSSHHVDEFIRSSVKL